MIGGAGGQMRQGLVAHECYVRTIHLSRRYGGEIGVYLVRKSGTAGKGDCLIFGVVNRLSEPRDLLPGAGFQDDRD